MVACCCKHGYKRHDCLDCEKNRRTAVDGIPRTITEDGNIMKLDWQMPADGVEDLSGEELEQHIQRLIDTQSSQD